MAAPETVSTKSLLKSNTEKLFRERGFAATGMRDIARSCGIEAPSIYNHYASKDELLKEICFDMATRFTEAFDLATAEEKSLPKKLRLAIKAHAGAIANHIDAAGVCLNEWMFLKGADLDRFLKLRNQYEARFHDLLVRGVEKGEFKDLNARLTMFVIFSALNATDDLYRTKEKLTQEQIADDISIILLKGIRK